MKITITEEWRKQMAEDNAWRDDAPEGCTTKREYNAWVRENNKAEDDAEEDYIMEDLWEHIQKFDSPELSETDLKMFMRRICRRKANQ